MIKSCYITQNLQIEVQRLIRNLPAVLTLLLFNFLLTIYKTWGQTPAEVNTSILSNFNDYRNKIFQEKIYLHTDKSLYVTGEILWCKAYLTDAHLHKFSDISKIAYIELYNALDKPVWQASIGLESGTGEASFVIPSTVVTGTYTLRAYTNIMKNLDPGFYFEKVITLINPLKKPQDTNEKYQSEWNLDFFPEGGHIVSGLPTHMAFRAIDKKGKNASVSGWLMSSQTDTISTLETNKLGLGDVQFIPEKGKIYFALIHLPEGNLQEFPLPEPEQTGYTMRVSKKEANQLIVTVYSNSSSSTNRCYLFIHCRQTNLKVITGVFENGKAEFFVNEKELSDGISHFTLFNDQQKPVLERLYFRQPEKIMEIELNTSNQIFLQKAIVDLSFHTRLPGGNSTSASVSISVVKIDSLEKIDDRNIINYLYLQSDITERIESPGVYFENSKKSTDNLSNLLMLTLGWRRFKWEYMNEPTKNKSVYLPEYSGPIMSAKMTDKNGNPAPQGIMAYATIPGKRYETIISKTNEEGELLFLFNQNAGTGTLALQPELKLDSSWQISQSSNYSTLFSDKKKQGFPFSENESSAISSLVFESQLESAFRNEGSFSFQSILKSDTTSFFGLPDKNYRLDDYTQFNSLEEVFREYIPEVEVRKNKGNFKLFVNNLPYKTFFKEDPLILVDGVPVSDIDRVMAFAPQQVESISVLAHRYYISGLTFPGIISLQTYTGDLGGFNLDPRVLLVDFDGLQVKREFYSPKYEKQPAEENRLPDLRRLLFWSPSLHTNSGGKANLTFYTSNIRGKYAIIIEGLNDSGYPGSAVHYFEVR